jgi:DNA-binding NtrC family response regulator
MDDREERVELVARDSAGPAGLWGDVAADGLPGMIGAAPVMLELARLVRRVARLPVAVLLRGESGTGKDLVARAIHALSARRAEPFVAINSAGLDDQLGQSTLFGHVRGAFTGAAVRREGCFRKAHRGTLFIDEIGAMPLAVQAMLLRVLETGVVTPLGGDTQTHVDVRVVAATCEGLEDRVGEGAFRADLYQRLAGCVVVVPPLRERLEDLPRLCEAGLADLFPGMALSRAALDALARHGFPGNVRELRNVLVQAALGADGGVIEACHVRAVLSARRSPSVRPPPTDRPAPKLGDEALLAILAKCDGSLSAGARCAGLPRSTFRDRVHKAQVRQRAREQRGVARPQNSPTSAAPRPSLPMAGTSMIEPAWPAESSESTK